MNEWVLVIVVKNERWFEEQTEISIQCYCRTRKEGVMWVCLNQGEEKMKEWMRWIKRIWVQEDFYYLRREIEGGMWDGCYWGLMNEIQRKNEDKIMREELGVLWESWRD